jgi:glycosyltransferase involved in cell wall biosynthesis
MKVLFDHQIYIAQQFGGISRYFNEISKDSTELEVIKISPDIFKQVKRKPFVERGMGFVKRKLGLQKQVGDVFPSEAAAILKHADYDLLHPTYYQDYFLSYTDKPYVLTVYDMIHEIFCEYFHLEDEVLQNKRKLCVNAKRIIAISECTKKDLVSIYNIPEEKIDVILLASSFSEIQPVQPAAFEVQGKYILFVGNRGSYKNFYFTVVALANILISRNDISIVCTGHAFSASELALFKNLKIENKLFHLYLASDSELSWLYRNAEMFIFPSLYEGFGFPLLEAFASSCPVVSSNGGSLPEVGGNAALYFNPKNAEEIQSAVVEVLDNPSTRKNLIGEGLKRIQEFSWEKCRAETIQTYQKALQ